ncbi:MAG: trigger factor [bacterium]
MSFTSSVEEINSVQRRIKVALPADLVAKAFEDAYRNVQKKAKLQGFRPGKAPLNMIKKLYGDTVRSEVGERLINKHLFDVLKEKKINPIAAPVVENMDMPSTDKEFNFSAVVDVMPEITIKDWKGLDLKADKYEVKPESMTREMDFLRRRQAKTKNLESGVAASSGHLASIGHKVYHNGSLLENMDVEEFPVALGFKEIFADLENAILGMRVGETKKSTITLPKDYNDASLAGKAVDFEITLKNLQELALPELGDDFAKDVGFDSLSALETEISKQLNKRGQQLRRQKLEASIMDELRGRNSFDVPPSMVDQVIDSMIMELNIGDEKEKKKLLRNEDVRKSFRDTAKTKTQNTLILWRVAQEEKLEVTDEHVRGHIIENVPGSEKWDEKKLTDFVQQVKPRVQENLVFEMALNHIIAKAKLTETVVAL